MLHYCSVNVNNAELFFNTTIDFRKWRFISTQFEFVQNLKKRKSFITYLSNQSNCKNRKIHQKGKNIANYNEKSNICIPYRLWFCPPYGFIFSAFLLLFCLECLQDVTKSLLIKNNQQNRHQLLLVIWYKQLFPLRFNRMF